MLPGGRGEKIIRSRIDRGDISSAFYPALRRQDVLSGVTTID